MYIEAFLLEAVEAVEASSLDFLRLEISTTRTHTSNIGSRCLFTFINKRCHIENHGAEKIGKQSLNINKDLFTFSMLSTRCPLQYCYPLLFNLLDSAGIKSASAVHQLSSHHYYLLQTILQDESVTNYVTQLKCYYLKTQVDRGTFIRLYAAVSTSNKSSLLLSYCLFRLFVLVHLIKHIQRSAFKLLLFFHA